MLKRCKTEKQKNEEKRKEIALQECSKHVESMQNKVNYRKRIALQAH